MRASGGTGGSTRRRAGAALVLGLGGAIALAHLLATPPAQAQAPQATTPPEAAQSGPVGRVSGLPVPRFVSLKADKVNVRSGPTRDHAVAWVFTRAGLPVEITAEFETWRRIRDADGAEGWVYHSMLSARRTALVSPWSKGEPTALREQPSTDSAIKARLEPGVLGKVDHCNGKWCRFFDSGFDGYVEQERLWGVYPGEKID
ncbi:SH3 domain-containing protein [Ancylobacter sp. WKF20]|uniref:SH3 domain-containing protein n=1 Tax=Ancylobacter sp. WKF20 TaxID=3039801 RepID=UPI0024341718|nr:SH3 domain-containing protein [Ancylobacter sp. WKF20]WGD28352.1 SH3 domain-containing protein [Ancylobacter sp. WKF20]